MPPSLTASLTERLPPRVKRLVDELSARVPLAWRNCTSDRKRLTRAVLGVTAAALLIIMQLGFRDAFLESALTIVKALDGDLVITSTTRYQIGLSEQVSRRRLYQALAVPGVDSVAPLYFSSGKARWRSPVDGRTFSVRTVAIDPDRPALRLKGLDENLEALKRPNTAVMDSRGRRHIGEIVPGLESELARRAVTIVGTFPMGPDFLTDSTVIMSERNFITYFDDAEAPGALKENVDFAMIKLRPGTDREEARAALASVLPGDVRVITRDELVKVETAFQAALTPVGPIFTLGSAIGFVIGILIAYQILYTEISDRLPQFATLKAMGYRRIYLLGVILRQSVIYGLIGFVVALMIAAVIFALIDWLFLIPMRIGAGLFWTTGIMLIVMCVLAGLIAARRALTADPADVF